MHLVGELVAELDEENDFHVLEQKLRFMKDAFICCLQVLPLSCSVPETQ